MTKELLENLLIEFDEMGFEPTTLCDSQREVDSFRNRLKQALLKSQEQEKVLEVIKNKEVDMKLFFNALFREQQYKINPLEFYNGSVGYKRLWLTQEEFDLLKRYFK